MRILVTGANGFLGRHLMHKLRSMGFDPYPVHSTAYDLRSQAHLDALFKHTGIPDLIYHAAAHVGGIAHNLANPATIFYDNVLMNTLLIHKAALSGVGKFVFVSSACAYPKDNPTPTPESNLWNGYPEESNGTYGIGKRIVLPQLKAYYEQFGMRFAYPILANLYGPGDDFSIEKSHVIASLIRKMSSQPEALQVWGDGSATRDFLYVEDAADALARFVRMDYQEPVNIATQTQVSIRQIVELLTEIMGYKGLVIYDQSKPAGQQVRCYSNSLAGLVLDWYPQTDIETGLRKTVEWFNGL